LLPTYPWSQTRIIQYFIFGLLKRFSYKTYWTYFAAWWDRWIDCIFKCIETRCRRIQNRDCFKPEHHSNLKVIIAFIWEGLFIHMYHIQLLHENNKKYNYNQVLFSADLLRCCHYNSKDVYRQNVINFFPRS